MAFDDKILHSVDGVTNLEFSGDGEYMVGWATTGIGRIAITNKPTVAFGSGVLCIDPAFNGLTLCDDVQLVAAFARAFQGYNPFHGADGSKWASDHIVQGEAMLDSDMYPVGPFVHFSPEEALSYLIDHGIPSPGVPF